MCKGVQWCMAVMHGSVRSVIIMIIIITVIIIIIITIIIIIIIIIIINNNIPPGYNITTSTCNIYNNFY